MLTIQDMERRVAELKELKDGWYENDGIAPSHVLLDWIVAHIKKYFTYDIPLPYMYPTFEGKVSLEWDINDWNINIEVCMNDESSFHSLNTETEEFYEYDLEHEEDWKELIQYLKKYINGENK